MTVQNPLELVLKAPKIFPTSQTAVTKWISSIAPNFLFFVEREVTLERHPLQNLYQLVQKAIRGEAVPDLLQKLNIVPEKLRNAIFFEVRSPTSDVDKNSRQYEEHQMLNDHGHLLNAIEKVVVKALDLQPQKIKNAIYGTIYRMGGQPQTDDFKWGENHAKDDLMRLLRALHRHQRLEIPGKKIFVYADLEKDIAQPSCHFHLHRKELTRGQIGMQNGMSCPFDAARWSASRISDDSAQGYNIHGTYSATVDPRWDLASAILTQGGTITPSVVQLLEQWQDFAESCENDRLLQLCTSRGGIEVYTALSHAPKDLQQRIIVITIATACLIPQELAYKAFNLVILSDPILEVAANRDLLDHPYTIKLPSHKDSSEPHNLHGASFREQLTPMINQYIATNDIRLG